MLHYTNDHLWNLWSTNRPHPTHSFLSVQPPVYAADFFSAKVMDLSFVSNHFGGVSFSNILDCQKYLNLSCIFHTHLS